MRPAKPFEEYQAARSKAGHSLSGRLRGVLSYLAPAAVVAMALGLLLAARSGAEAAAVGIAAALPIGYALGAGMVASVNPCGFMLLPSYISFNLGADDSGYYSTPVWLRAAKALLLGVSATAGFVVVFAGAGAVITLGGRWLTELFPHLGTLVGIAMAAVGMWLLLSNRTLGINAATRISFAPRRSPLGGVLFGVAYGLGSLGCTLPIFLVVVGGTLTGQGWGHALGQYVSYSLGMGVVLTAVTLGVALLRGAVGRVLRPATSYVHRASAMFLVGAGAYLVYYWAFYARY